MAYVNTTHQSAAPRSLRSYISDLATRYELFQSYRSTLRELNTLTNRELADLGMHRSELRRIAYDAVYGEV